MTGFVNAIFDFLDDAKKAKKREKAAFARAEADLESEDDEQHASDEEAEELEGFVRDCHEDLDPESL